VVGEHGVIAKTRPRRSFCASTVEHAPVLALFKPQVGVVIGSFEGSDVHREQA
jgi:hypothetical protein